MIDSRKTLRPQVSAVLALSVATAVAGVGAVALVNAASRLGPGPTVPSLLVVTACVGITTVLGHHRAMEQEGANLDRLFDDELREYDRWRERLSDRPNDVEMARWLENDKSHLKTRAIHRCALSNRDVIAHIVLTEGRWWAKRGRVAHGPPRFSKYVVLVFLLTDNGVREVGFDLDFETAVVYNERRHLVRLRRPRLGQCDRGGLPGWQRGAGTIVRLASEVLVTEKASLVLRRTLRLSLVNQEDIEIMVNNFQGLLEESTDEDQSHLDNVDFDASGVAVALHILEAVAAEGREWIAWERGLRERRWQDWERSRLGRDMLVGSAEPLQIEQPPDLR